MKNIKTYTGKLVITGRLKSSYYGNPRFEGYIETAETAFTHAWIKRIPFKTAVNSGLAYAIENYRDKNCTVEIGEHYGVKTIHSIKEREL